MDYRIILDGALFSECSMAGENRYGMLRVAEEITNELLKNKQIEVAFANTIPLPKYHLGLLNYIKELKGHAGIKILTHSPADFTKLLEWKSLYFRLQPFFSFSNTVKDINTYDIFHSFYYPIPNSIRSVKIKKSITFLDIIPLKMDGYPRTIVHRTKEIVKDVKNNFSFSISEFSKNDILNYDSSINPDSIFVAPLAASPSLFYINKNKEEWEHAKKKYALPENYFLAVSSNDKRKNIPHLIKSFNKFLLQTKQNNISLLLIGNYKFSNLDLDVLGIDKAVQKKIIIPEIFIDNADLSVIYSNALCFYFMSLYEGFGLPALEAMQCGIPVVASDTSSIPEVVEDAGILISPVDEDQLCSVMEKISSDADLRNSMSKKSILQSEKFSWKACASIYNESFKKMLAQ